MTQKEILTDSPLAMVFMLLTDYVNTAILHETFCEDAAISYTFLWNYE